MVCTGKQQVLVFVSRRSQDFVQPDIQEANQIGQILFGTVHWQPACVLSGSSSIGATQNGVLSRIKATGQAGVSRIISHCVLVSWQTGSEHFFAEPSLDRVESEGKRAGECVSRKWYPLPNNVEVQKESSCPKAKPGSLNLKEGVLFSRLGKGGQKETAYRIPPSH